MNSKQLHLETIEKILKMVGNGQGSIRQQLGLDHEEFLEHYSHLLRSGLAKADTGNGHNSFLQLTPSGEALLLLIDGIDALDASDVEEGAVEYAEEVGMELSGRELSDTMEWRDRLLRSYVLEQAEVARLQAQLRDDDDEEGELELEQRQQRLGWLQNLLEMFQRLLGEAGG